MLSVSHVAYPDVSSMMQQQRGRPPAVTHMPTSWPSGTPSSPVSESPEALYCRQTSWSPGGGSFDTATPAQGRCGRLSRRDDIDDLPPPPEPHQFIVGMDDLPLPPPPDDMELCAVTGFQSGIAADSAKGAASAKGLRTVPSREDLSAALRRATFKRAASATCIEASTRDRDGTSTTSGSFTAIIQQGVKLKRTVTNDRSVPRLI